MTNEYLDLDDIPVDADESLITAFLSGEMSIAESEAIDERLADEPIFRAKVQPIIDAWYLPVSFATPEDAAFLAAVPQEPMLSPEKLQAGVDRFFRERRTRLGQPEPVPVETKPVMPSGTHFNPWTLGRIAALIMTIMGSGATFFGLTGAIMRLDHGPHEAPGERVSGWWYQATVPPFPLGVRRIEIGNGTVVTLAADSRLTFRPVARASGFVVNVEGEATIEVPANEVVYLATPEVHATLNPGRYSFRSLDEKTPMVARVDSGSMIVMARGTQQNLVVGASQFMRASVGHDATLSAPQRDLPRTR